MEYAKKCRDCEYRQTVLCYGVQKHQRTGNCFAQFQEVRHTWVKNLPPEVSTAK